MDTMKTVYALATAANACMLVASIAMGLWDMAMVNIMSGLLCGLGWKIERDKENQ